MRDYLKRHLPIVMTAVLVAGLMTTGPAAARAVYDTVNAHMVDGKHAVDSNSTVAHRAGQLVATNATGRLPNDIIARAPDSAKLDGLPLSAFAPTILYASGSANLEPGPACQTSSFTPTRPSFAVIRVDADIFGAHGSGTGYAVQPGYSTNGGLTYSKASPSWWTETIAAPQTLAAVGNSGVVRLAAGRAYRFAAKQAVFIRGGGGGDCKLIVEILPKFPGSKIIGSAPQARGHSGQQITRR
jgi:hypothetical protein